MKIRVLGENDLDAVVEIDKKILGKKDALIGNERSHTPTFILVLL
jgi:hypothetical protein